MRPARHTCPAGSAPTPLQHLSLLFQECGLKSGRAEPKDSAFIIASRDEKAERLWRRANKNKSFITSTAAAAAAEAGPENERPLLQRPDNPQPLRTSGPAALTRHNRVLQV